MQNTILRLPAVKARTGLSRSTIYLRISEDRFPKPISLGGRAVGWVEVEVNDYVGLLRFLSNDSVLVFSLLLAPMRGPLPFF